MCPMSNSKGKKTCQALSTYNLILYLILLELLKSLKFKVHDRKDFFFNEFCSARYPQCLEVWTQNRLSKGLVNK